MYRFRAGTVSKVRVQEGIDYTIRRTPSGSSVSIDAQGLDVRATRRQWPFSGTIDVRRVRSDGGGVRQVANVSGGGVVMQAGGNMTLNDVSISGGDIPAPQSSQVTINAPEGVEVTPF